MPTNKYYAILLTERIMFNHCRGGYEKYVNMDDKGQTSEPDCYPRHARDQYSCDKAIVDRYRRRQHFFFSQAEVDGIKWRVINPSSGHERLTSGHLTRHDSIVGTCTSCPDKSAYMYMYMYMKVHVACTNHANNRLKARLAIGSMSQ